MNAQEKKKFINDLIGRVRKGVLSNVKYMPDNWSGGQLREYIANHFEVQRLPLSKSEKRDFDNDIFTSSRL